METNEVNEIVLKLLLPIFIKTKIQNYQVFYEDIIIKPTDDFTCKSFNDTRKPNITT